MTVKVLHPGLLTTIQDLGRFGSQQYGVIVSGAMDQLFPSNRQFTCWKRTKRRCT